jgi:hypothetical protein
VICVFCQSLGELSAGLLGDIDECDPGALFGETFDECCADSRAAAGNQDAAPTEIGMADGWLCQMILPLMSRGKLTPGC